MTDTPYDGLQPPQILGALEQLGYQPTGALLALNSFENRVYQAELDDGEFKVVKFYRPGRWTAEQIVEEHAFCEELAEAELPIVLPEARDGATLHEYQDFRFAVFPRRGGRPPDIENENNLKVLARTIARIHAVGATQPFAHRRALTVDQLGWQSRTFLLENQWLPMDVETAYASLTEQLLTRIAEIDDSPAQRIHGDCHLGNVLWRDDTPNFVDFDDCVSGPPIQDLWMLLSGERDQQQTQLGKILEAYETFAWFPMQSIALIEGLRTLRIMHHAAWIARRWSDPAFPPAFPTFGTTKYWSEHVLDLRMQMAALDEPPLSV